MLAVAIAPYGNAESVPYVVFFCARNGRLQMQAGFTSRHVTRITVQQKYLLLEDAQLLPLEHLSRRKNLPFFLRESVPLGLVSSVSEHTCLLHGRV